MERGITFSVPEEELSCILGNLFTNLEPPCGRVEIHALAICGYTHNGKYARLLAYDDRCVFFGDPEDLAAVRCGACLERKCKSG